MFDCPHASGVRYAPRKERLAPPSACGRAPRDALRAAAQPSKKEAWAAADRIRAKIRARVGHDLPDSTAGIREDRDNNEPYR
jgi:hypothetical protein